MEGKDFYVYVIESINHGIRYVGMSEDPEKRLVEHNQGKSKFTSAYGPWNLIYKEFAGNVSNARKLEKYYKSSTGRRKISKQFPKSGDY